MRCGFCSVPLPRGVFTSEMGKTAWICYQCGVMYSEDGVLKRVLGIRIKRWIDVPFGCIINFDEREV